MRYSCTCSIHKLYSVERCFDYEKRTYKVKRIIVKIPIWVLIRLPMMILTEKNSFLAELF